jgi:hypothetical protein
MGGKDRSSLLLPQHSGCRLVAADAVAAGAGAGAAAAAAAVARSVVHFELLQAPPANARPDNKMPLRHSRRNVRPRHCQQTRANGTPDDDDEDTHDPLRRTRRGRPDKKIPRHQRHDHRDKFLPPEEGDGRHQQQGREDDDAMPKEQGDARGNGTTQRRCNASKSRSDTT